MNLENTLNSLEEIVPSQHNFVVAAEIGDNRDATLFIRDKDSVTSKQIKFDPFLLLSKPDLLADAGVDCELIALKEDVNTTGERRFSYLAKFADIATYRKVLAFLKTSTGYSPSAPFSPYKAISDLQQQLLISADFRLFRGMTFSEIRRFQFDIETLTTQGYEFPNAKRANDQIAMISMSDNTGWEKCLVLNDPYSEQELLEKFVKTIQERDPDVLEGHNIFKFDLPFIEERAKKHHVKLLLGRNSSEIKKRPSRLTIAERTLNYPKYETYGRHFIDTFHLVQHYDVIHRELESFGLKAVAKHFGVAATDRTYVEGGNITEIFKSDPKTLTAYALDDVRETRAISKILSPSYFYQTQLIPISYQNCVVRGNASRIESMLLAAYINGKASIPVPEPSRPFSGALTDAPESGVFENIWHCDIRSLYPSIILAEKWTPSRDHLGIFPFYLDKLRSFRLAAKDAEKKAEAKEEQDEYNALQTTFKILINSFYGYLGFAMGSFNDYAMADKVTTMGREILTSMLKFLKAEGAKIIEMDTDGIYFQPKTEKPGSPDLSDSPAEMEKKIQNILPEGIEVELDAVHPAMFSYKSKNYALLHENGEVSITGAALKSRGLEPFQRNYMKKLMAYLLKQDFDAIEEMTSEYKDAIGNRKWELAKFAKSETLKDSPKKYSEKIGSGKGRRSAAYELALNSDRKYSQGDQISYYVTGEKKKVSVVDNSTLLRDAPEQRDENVTYYLGKLDDMIAKFAEFVPQNNTEDLPLSDEDNPLGLEF
jgi:DNA polymerase, archaea type